MTLDQYLFFSLALGFGLVVWYFYYGLECFINGGSLGRNPYTMVFTLWFEELTWLFPGGWEKKLKLCHGDEALARSLPGFWHFLIVHVVIPFGPAFYVLYVFHKNS